MTSGASGATAVNSSTTPGSTSPGASQETLCASAVKAPRLTKTLKAQVFAAYHVKKKQQRRYVIDRLVPASLGGTNDLTNLWPQLRADAAAKNAEATSIRASVCSGKVDLPTAQQAYASNWSTATQVVKAKADANAAALGQYLEAQKKADQDAIAQYIAGLEAAKRAEAEAAARAEAERQAQQQQQSCPNGTYVNSVGNTVCSPYSSPSGPPAGASAQCRDGSYSFSQSRSGTCSSHGGVAQWL